jgi:tetratricopeptide (TPR) repeat protein
MKRTILSVSLALLSPALALPQAPSTPTIQEVLSSTLADLHGLDEAIDRSGAENWGDRRVLWFSAVNGPMVSTVRLPAQVGSPAGTVSVKRLRHRAPKAARAAYEKAAKLARSKADQKAAKELERAIELDPDFAEAHGDLGVMYASLGRYPEAEAELRRAIELIPDESLPHSNLAWVLFALDQRAEAEVNVRRAIQLSPDNASAHMLIGRLLAEKPETLAEGLGHLKYAARTIPEAKRMVTALNRK